MKFRVTLIGGCLLGMLAGLGGCAFSTDSPLSRSRGNEGPFLLDRPADTRGSEEPREERGKGGVFPFNLFSKNDY